MKDSKYLIFGNYGNSTIALIRWAKSQDFSNVTIVSIDTNWSSKQWEIRVKEAHELAHGYGFQVERLKPKKNFQELVLDRQSFPSKKYQWCAYFLKGMTLNTWLDSHDFDNEFTILLPKSKVTNSNEPEGELIESSEYYGGRRVWSPLWKLDLKAIEELVNQTSMQLIKHKSLECEPCIHGVGELESLKGEQIEQVAKIERKIGKTMFKTRGEDSDNSIKVVVEYAVQDASNKRHMKHACVSNWVCGL